MRAYFTFLFFLLGLTLFAQEWEIHKPLFSLEAILIKEDISYFNREWLNIDDLNPFRKASLKTQAFIREMTSKDYKLDIYYPPSSDQHLQRELIVYIPDYNETRHNPSSIYFATQIARYGYVVAVADSRLQLIPHISHHRAMYMSIQDSRAAIQFLIGNNENMALISANKMSTLLVTALEQR